MEMYGPTSTARYISYNRKRSAAEQATKVRPSEPRGPQAGNAAVEHAQGTKSNSHDNTMWRCASGSFQVTFVRLHPLNWEANPDIHVPRLAFGTRMRTRKKVDGSEPSMSPPRLSAGPSHFLEFFAFVCSIPFVFVTHPRSTSQDTICCYLLYWRCKHSPSYTHLPKE